MEDVETGVWPIELEYRQRGRQLSGSFPYGAMGVIGDRGSVRKERFDPHAFRFAVEHPDREINLLAGHSFNSPLASKLSGSLKLRDTATALEFTAVLPPENRQPTWMRDTVLAVQGGLVRGVSPGFRVPPLDVVPDAESFIPEPGNPGVQIRVVRAAVLHELSLVTRPTYVDSTVDLRAFMVSEPIPTPSRRLEDAYRWL